ncbi:O-6-methylguanine DNA methyltransferase [Verrucomicrobia bacterium]|nr:O-6-methylguanine DNA methyltransferase [Verrucomicrobiota bacterium]
MGGRLLRQYAEGMSDLLVTVKPGKNGNASFDYARMEKAIGYLQTHFLEQPDLAGAARAAHLSEYHFQRIFTRWAGISPKRFLQFLTLEYAKRQLTDSKAVLAAALDSGLSGPGRLHDLFVSLEAVTPGEFKSRGAGLEIAYGHHATPFGPCLLGVTTRGVCWLSFTKSLGERKAVSELQAHWGGAKLAEDSTKTAPVAVKIFSTLGKRSNVPLSLLVMGTNFQIKVWQALLQIPPGKVVSYETVGELVGAPSASRAIGGAVGQNAIAYLIPCHRVIRKSGSLGGYRWGESRKRTLLAWEAARAQAGTTEQTPGR